MATAAANLTPGASSSATSSATSSGPNPVEPPRYARTLVPLSELTTSLTNINVYVYKKDEDILRTIDEFKDHLFAVVIYTNKTPKTTVYTQPDFIAFRKSQPVVPISHSSVSKDDVATTVAIAAAIAAPAVPAPTVETAPPKPSGLKTASLEGNADFIPNNND